MRILFMTMEVRRPGDGDEYSSDREVLGAGLVKYDAVIIKLIQFISGISRAHYSLANS